MSKSRILYSFILDRVAKGLPFTTTFNGELQEVHLPEDEKGTAEIPTPDAISRAHKVFDKIIELNLKVIEIDYDIMGGIAIFLTNPSEHKQVWIACMNEGRTTFVMTEISKVKGGGKLNDEAWFSIVEFLS